MIHQEVNELINIIESQQFAERGIGPALIGKLGCYQLGVCEGRIYPSARRIYP